MTKKGSKRGFTLVEMLVAVTIFTVVSVMVTTVFLSMAQGQRRAQSTKVVIDNLNFAMDTMTLELKDGFGYEIRDRGMVTAGSTGDGIQFYTGRESVDHVIYEHDHRDGYIRRKFGDDGGSLTDQQAVDIEDLTFTLLDDDDDDLQLVRISMKGEAMNEFGESIGFNIQTSVSKRRR